MNEYQAKRYKLSREADDFCDDAHVLFKKYMRKVGLAARKMRTIAEERAEHDFMSIVPDDFIDKCIDVSKTDEYGMPIPYAGGVRHTDESSSICWWAFYKEDLPSDIDLKDEGLAGNLTGLCRRYSGPGRSFSQEPTARISRTRVLVTQFCGLDI